MLSAATKTIILAALRSENVTNDKKMAALAVLEGRETNRAEQLPVLITQAAAARLASISRFTLRKLVKTGRIKPIEILPGLVRYRRSDIEAL